MTTFKDIVQTVSDYRGIHAVDILSPKRTFKIARARQEVAYLARSEKGMSLPNIGRHIHRDHTTVNHSINAVIRRMLDDKEYGAEIDAMVERLNPGPPVFKSVRAIQ